MKIAIVDDEQDMRQSISQWLALSGFETETYPLGRGGPEGDRCRFSRCRDHRREDAGDGWRHVPQAPDGAGQRAAGDHDHRPWRRSDGGGRDAHRRFRLPRKALQPRQDDGACQEGQPAAAHDARQPGAQAGACRRQGGHEEAHRLLARDGAAARGHPRPWSGRQPRADRRRDGDGQDAGGARAPCRGAARDKEVHHALVLRLGRAAVVRKSSSAPIRATRCPWWRRRVAGHALPRGYRGAAERDPGPPADLHQRAGDAAPDPHHRDLQRTHRRQDAGGQPAPPTCSSVSRP